ncbi:F-box domain-containing protein [Pleurotus pulmonarius]
MQVLNNLPLDILPSILSHLVDRRDCYSCTLVNKTFNRATTPILYRKLDSRVLSNTTLSHPFETLLIRPDLAQYVRHVTETGAVLRMLHVRYPNITEDTLRALSLCANIHSLTWVDDDSFSSSESPLLGLLPVLRSLPLRELTIRTHSDLGEHLWNELMQLNGLRRISIWCMAGPPAPLQTQVARVATTLTHLELGVSVFTSSTMDLFMHLYLLQELRLKGTPVSALASILVRLPNLHTFDVEYLMASPTSPLRHEFSSQGHTAPCPRLRKLIVRTNTSDPMGIEMLFPWIHTLLPRPSLESFHLHAFTSSSSGRVDIPKTFILDLARVHGSALKEFLVEDCFVALDDVQTLCKVFPRLENLSCALATPDVVSIAQSLSGARVLKRLKLQVQWTSSRGAADIDTSTNLPLTMSQSRRLRSSHIPYAARTPPKRLSRYPLFTADDARTLVVNSPLLNLVEVNTEHYLGKWILKDDRKRESGLVQVVEDISLPPVNWSKWY